MENRYYTDIPNKLIDLKLHPKKLWKIISYFTSQELLEKKDWKYFCEIGIAEFNLVTGKYEFLEDYRCEVVE